MSKKISSRLTAVAFAAALTLAGTAEAGPLFAGSAGVVEESPWSLAWEWLIGAWGDLTGLQSAAATDSVKTEVPPTTNSDVGCGIDPNGGPCGG
jgi:fermentation-respiration switch protein FrsA (DUF1100 family)